MAMTLAPFNGQLNPQEVYADIYNMIISQTVYSNPIRGTYGLADKFRKEGTLYGDTKLFYSVQIGTVADWTADSEAANLLNLKRAPAPYCQAVVIDVFKMVWLTVDNFLSKRAWGDEYTFGQFNSVVLGTIRDTKRVYEATMMNAFIGTHASTTGKQTVSVTLPTVTGSVEGSEDYTVTDTEALNRLQAQTVAKAIADLLVDVQDVSTEYNDLGYLRSYDESQLTFVVNADWYNKLLKLDLPTIFHKDGLIDKLGENVIPGRYFGDVNAASVTTSGSNNTTIRFLKDYTINDVYYRAGDLCPNNLTLSDGSTITYETYTVNDNIVCKVVVPEAIQYMSAFETQTEFYNPRSLTQNHYLIFGHSDLSKSVLKEFPYITIKTA